MPVPVIKIKVSRTHQNRLKSFLFHIIYPIMKEIIKKTREVIASKITFVHMASNFPRIS